MADNKIVTSIIWKILERSSVQIVNLLTQIVLARILAPEQFGQLAIIIVFYNIADLLVQKGFGSSLIRLNEVTNEEINSSFWASMVISAIMILCINIVAPLVAIIYDDQSLVMPLRVLALNLLASPLYCILNALYVRRMKFKALFFRSLIATIVSASVGITLALNNYGVMALVIQIVVHQYVVAIALLLGSKTRIGLKVSKTAFQNVFKFGKNVLISEFLLMCVENIRTLLIGKKYKQEDLAYYDRGQEYPATLMRAIYDTMFSVLVPFYSRVQNNKSELTQKYWKTTYLSMVCVCPVFLGLAAVSREIVDVLLTSKWSSCIPYMIIFCIYQSIFPYQITAKAVLYAVGVSGKVLRIETIKSIVSLGLVIISIQFGVNYVALSLILVRSIGNICYLVEVRKHTEDISGISCTWKPLIASIIMAMVVSVVRIGQSSLIALFSKVICGMIVYVILMLILDKDILKQIRNLRGEI